MFYIRTYKIDTMNKENDELLKLTSYVQISKYRENR